MEQLSPRTVTGHRLIPFPRSSSHQSSRPVHYLPIGYRRISALKYPSLSGLGQSAATTVLADAPKIATGLYTAITTSALIPIIGVAVAGVTLALSLIFNRKGPKQRVATTAIVNKVEPLLKQNLDGYLAGPRTLSSQAQALANFDAGWQYVVEYCDIPAMGNPGKACVSDRQSGACTWKASAGAWSADPSTGESKWTPAGAAGSGDACWNWFAGYRDPIANDPGVVPDPVLDAAGNVVTLTTDPATGEVVSTPFTGADTSSSSTLLIGAAALILGAVLLGGSK